jgi:SAM-dependent methyltransferase
MPWVEVVGVDVGKDFVAAATERNGSERVSFELQDFAEMSLSDASFDCVYADNSLEHAFDVDRTLAEVHRVLSDRGVLVAALPSDARNPCRITDNHTWKTAPHEVRMRLESAGFADVTVEEVDLYRALGQPPYPPSEDRMMYVTAWKQPRSALERVDALREWAYHALDPDCVQESDDPYAILAGGHAWCWGYALVIGEALRREGFAVRWITMVAGDHPRGRGPEREDSHEVVEVELPGGERHVVDAMANVRFARAVGELLREPRWADAPAAGAAGDKRWSERSYDLYATSFWYSRVRRVAVRRRPTDPLVWSGDPRDPAPPSRGRVGLARARDVLARTLSRL